MLTPIGWGFVALIVLSIFLASRILKRMGKGSKPGCVTYAYVSLVVFCCSLFALGISYMLVTWTYKKADALLNGESYMAKVVDVSEHEGEDSDGNTTTFYTSILQIELADGTSKTFEEDYSSSTPDQLGTEVKIIYNIENGRFLIFSAMTLISLVAMLIFCTVFLFAFVGIVYYSMGFNMSGFWSFTSSFFMLFFLPFMMIAFDALLIYALFYGNQVPLWATAILVFFILVLSLAIVGFIKHAIKKGAPKWRREGALRWTSNW